MNISALRPAVTQRLKFSFESHKFVSQNSGCYVLTTFDGTILYAGLTDNLHRRFKEHRENLDKCQSTAQGRAFWFYHLTVDEKEIGRIERTWLNAHMDEHGALPILNKVASPVR